MTKVFYTELLFVCIAFVVIIAHVGDPDNDKEVLPASETSQDDQNAENAHILTLVEALKELISAIERLETSACENPASNSAVQTLQELVNAFDGLRNTTTRCRQELAGTFHISAIDYVIHQSMLVGLSSVSQHSANDPESITPVAKHTLLNINGSAITVTTVNGDTVANSVCHP